LRSRRFAIETIAPRRCEHRGGDHKYARLEPEAAEYWYTAAWHPPAANSVAKIAVRCLISR
jgi:hypothetical protein